VKVYKDSPGPARLVASFQLSGYLLVPLDPGCPVYILTFLCPSRFPPPPHPTLGNARHESPAFDLNPPSPFFHCPPFVSPPAPSPLPSVIDAFTTGRLAHLFRPRCPRASREEISSCFPTKFALRQLWTLVSLTGLRTCPRPILPFRGTLCNDPLDVYPFPAFTGSPRGPLSLFQV